MRATAGWVAVLGMVLAFSADAPAKPRGKKASPAKAAPKPAPEPVAAEPVPVPPVTSTRPDGLRVVVVDTPGPAVAVRLAVDFAGPTAKHPAPGAAPVVANAALFSGGGAETLRQGGAGRHVSVVNQALVLGMDTVSERWKDDLVAFLDAVSRPALDDRVMEAAALRQIPMGPGLGTLEAVFSEAMTRLRPRDVALDEEQARRAPTLDTATWHVEEAWLADRMTLVVAGHVPPADVAALVDSRFLVPPGPPSEAPPAATEEARAVGEDDKGAGPGRVAVGAFAEKLAPEDAVILAQVLQERLDKDAPQAGACIARYEPGRARALILALCSDVQGTALDVRETMKGLLDAAAPPPTSAEVSRARRAALVALAADHASAPRMAARLTTWALAGWDGGRALETSVQAAPEARVIDAWKLLVDPAVAITLHRRGRGAP